MNLSVSADHLAFIRRGHLEQCLKIFLSFLISIAFLSGFLHFAKNLDNDILLGSDAILLSRR
jgi:hypothetical protein